MMEAALCDPPALSASCFKCYGDVEAPPRGLAVPGGNDPRALPLRDPDCALMRVTRQKSYRPRWRRLIYQHRMHITHHFHLLKVTIGSRMEIRPIDIECVGIIALQRKA